MKDMFHLEEVFRKNYAIKKRWRNGIINSNRSAVLVTGTASIAAQAATHILGMQGLGSQSEAYINS